MLTAADANVCPSVGKSLLVPKGIKLLCKINFTAYAFVKELVIKLQQLKNGVQKGSRDWSQER
jgi:hypothetical protein